MPAGQINPAVVEAMTDIGLDVTHDFPEPLTDVVQAADVVITMGCGDACPIYPGKRYLDWDTPNPLAAQMSWTSELALRSALTPGTISASM
jgi:arsenate reductase